MEQTSIRNLESHADNLSKVQIDDISSQKNIAYLIDALKNRLSFVDPVNKNGKSYLIGSYQGDESRLNFLLDIEPIGKTKQTITMDPYYKQVYF